MTGKSIKSWAVEDRPREKMLAKGKESLTNVELMAILLGSGSQDETAVQLAQRVLQSVKSLNDLGKKELQFLEQFKGIGQAKAVTIAAALELGRRRQTEEIADRKKITCSTDIYNHFGPRMRDLGHEECWMLSLNRRSLIISEDIISRGGIGNTVIDPKVVYGTALLHKASSIAIVHNHPSGLIDPSKQDIALTEKLVEAAGFLTIHFADHIIIGDSNYYSFRDHNMI